MTNKFRYPKKYYESLSGISTYEVSVYTGDPTAKAIIEQSRNIKEIKKNEDTALRAAAMLSYIDKSSNQNSNQKSDQNQIKNIDQSYDQNLYNIQQVSETANQDFTVPSSTKSEISVAPIAIGAVGILAYLLMR